MAPSAQILNWLIIGVEQPTGSLTENFYFDKRANEFFSIMAADYFMLDENMNIASGVLTNYSKKQENSLVDRMKRIENKDTTIVPVPRIPLEDRKSCMRQFVSTLSDKNLIDILNQRIQNQDYRTKFDFYFGNEANEETRQKWKEIKTNFLTQRVNSFLNLHNINIDNTTLWIVDSEGSISIDLTEGKKIEALPTPYETRNRKRWWKFWQ